MQRALQEVEIERDLLERVMDRLPLGMAIVDVQGMAISMNRAMLSLVQSGAGLGLQAGRLVSSDPQALLAAIGQVMALPQGQACLRLPPAGTEADRTLDASSTAAPGGLSLWLSHFGAGKAAKRVMVLAASPGSRALSVDGLVAFFGLSAAEARFTQQLALGQGQQIAVLAVAVGSKREIQRSGRLALGDRFDAERAHAMNATHAAAAIIADLKVHIGTQKVHDDITLVVVKHR